MLTPVPLGRCLLVAAIGVAGIGGALAGERTSERIGEMFRQVLERHTRIQEAVRRNLVMPSGLPPGMACRIEVVQDPSGSVLAVNAIDCSAVALERAVRDAVARTSLPPPLQFPEDPPLLRSTSTLEFHSR